MSAFGNNFGFGDDKKGDILCVNCKQTSCIPIQDTLYTHMCRVCSHRFRHNWSLSTTTFPPCCDPVSAPAVASGQSWETSFPGPAAAPAPVSSGVASFDGHSVAQPFGTDLTLPKFDFPGMSTAASGTQFPAPAPPVAFNPVPWTVPDVKSVASTNNATSPSPAATTQPTTAIKPGKDGLPYETCEWILDKAGTKQVQYRTCDKCLKIITEYPFFACLCCANVDLCTKCEKTCSTSLSGLTPETASHLKPKYFHDTHLFTHIRDYSDINKTNMCRSWIVLGRNK